MQLDEKTKCNKAKTMSGLIEYARAVQFSVGCMVYQVWTGVNWMQKISYVW
jgi:hypothetical protein